MLSSHIRVAFETTAGIEEDMVAIVNGWEGEVFVRRKTGKRLEWADKREEGQAGEGDLYTHSGMRNGAPDGGLESAGTS